MSFLLTKSHRGLQLSMGSYFPDGRRISSRRLYPLISSRVCSSVGVLSPIRNLPIQHLTKPDFWVMEHTSTARSFSAGLILASRSCLPAPSPFQTRSSTGELILENRFYDGQVSSMPYLKMVVILRTWCWSIAAATLTAHNSVAVMLILIASFSMVWRILALRNSIQ